MKKRNIFKNVVLILSYYKKKTFATYIKYLKKKKLIYIILK